MKKKKNKKIKEKLIMVVKKIAGRRTRSILKWGKKGRPIQKNNKKIYTKMEM